MLMTGADSVAAATEVVMVVAATEAVTAAAATEVVMVVAATEAVTEAAATEVVTVVVTVGVTVAEVTEVVEEATAEIVGREQVAAPMEAGWRVQGLESSQY